MNWFEKKRSTIWQERIFLDYASATPILPEVRKAMEKYWSKDFYNSSAIYKEGVKVKEMVKENRARVARSLGISPSGVIFTSGGTESNNLAILGAFETFVETHNKKPHVIVSAIEHHAVMGAAREVVRRGGEMSIVGVDDDGRVLVEELKKLLKKNTFLVSIGLANGEIGTIEPLSKIGRLVREHRKNSNSSFPYLHTDASQAPNYMDVSLEGLNVDLMTLDGSKIYGPKGVGVLATRKSLKLNPIIYGGAQEEGRRAGTLNTALIAGFATALDVAQRDREKESARLEDLRKYFTELIMNLAPKVVINGSQLYHLPNIVSVSMLGALSEFILLKLDQEGVMVSIGSACSLDEKVEGSEVIRALGRSNLAESTIRFSFGRGTTKKELEKTAKIFCKICQSVLK